MKSSKIVLFLSASVMIAACRGSLVPDVDLEGYTMLEAEMETIAIDDAGAPYSAVWNSGDCIGIYGSIQGKNTKYVMRREDVTNSSAHFYGPLVKGSLLAYYPYKEGLESENGCIPVELSPVQKYDPNLSAEEFFLQYNSTMAAVSDEGRLCFRYPFGIVAVRFLFRTPMDISSISISSDRGLAGRLLMDEGLQIVTPDNAFKTISLDFSGGIYSSADSEGYRDFFFVLPPAVYPDNALRLELLSGEETIQMNLKGFTVERVSRGQFDVTALTITPDEIPGFELTDGYLEF